MRQNDKLGPWVVLSIRWSSPSSRPCGSENRLLCSVYFGAKQRWGLTSEAWWVFFFFPNSPFGTTEWVFSFLCTRPWSLSLHSAEKYYKKEKSNPSFVFLCPFLSCFQSSRRQGREAQAGTTSHFHLFFSFPLKYFLEDLFFVLPRSYKPDCRCFSPQNLLKMK